MMPELTAIPYLARLDAGIVSAKYILEAHKLTLPQKPYMKRPIRIVQKLSMSISPTAMNIAKLLQIKALRLPLTVISPDRIHPMVTPTIAQVAIIVSFSLRLSPQSSQSLIISPITLLPARPKPHYQQQAQRFKVIESRKQVFVFSSLSIINY